MTSSRPDHKAPPAAAMHPSDLVDLIASGPVVALQGFTDRSARRGPTTHPAVPFIPARMFDRAAPVINRSVVTWRRVVFVLVGLALFFLGCALGILGALAAARLELGASQVLPPWKMIQVVEQGVIVESGDRKDLFPIGSKLPNGDPVVSVFPTRNVVVLGSATIMLREQEQTK